MFGPSDGWDMLTPEQQKVVEESEANPAVPLEHQLVPENPKDGDKFTCPRCKESAEFIKLDDDHEGEWVWS